jgi:channel protein, hemolysin III family
MRTHFLLDFAFFCGRMNISTEHDVSTTRFDLQPNRRKGWAIIVKKTPKNNRELPGYTKKEERLHTASHIVGCVFGIVALSFCSYISVRNDDAVGLAASVVYGVCMIILYLFSSIYHGLSPELPLKKLFRTLDHCSIFLLIAGTYTPIVLCAIRSQNVRLGWVVFGIIWTVALVGIVLNAIDIKKYQLFSMVCYLIMGWGILFVAKPLYRALKSGGLTLLVAGGICYSVGAAIYAKFKRIRYSHAVFHLLVLAGSTLHFFCITHYVL